ncbi:hypothetical protein ABW636_22090 [Aquimarina sp. 2201CG1-2-11]|uniref:hypothetical protein n=1 Tax=Aquimarina discodermiae TaxID=3231043 RepID=UPI0034620616
MFQCIIVHIITLLFTAAFLAPRVVDLHILNHLSEDDEPVSCELCDILVYSHQLDLFHNDHSHLEKEQSNIPSSFIALIQYRGPQEKIASPTFVYNKPPPFL